MSDMSAAILNSLFNASIYITVFAIAILILRKPVHHFWGAKWAYCLWALPFLWVATYIFGSSLPTVEWGFEFPSMTVNSLGSTVLSVPSNTKSTHLNFIPSILVSIWFSVALLQLFALAIAFTRMKSVIKKAKKRSSDLNGHLIIEEIGSPAVWGILNYKILLPANFKQQFTATQQKLILQHEMIHIRRHDNLFNLAAILLVTTFWFNPLIYLAHRAFKLDQEASCDAAVLQESGNSILSHYAQAMLKVSQSHKAFNHRFSQAISQWRTRSQTMERMTMLTKHQRTFNSNRNGLGGMFLLALTTVFISACQATYDTKKQSEFTNNVTLESNSVTLSDNKIIYKGDAKMTRDGANSFVITADRIEFDKGEPNQAVATGKVTLATEQQTMMANDARIVVSGEEVTLTAKEVTTLTKT